MNEAWRELYPFKSNYLDLNGHQYHYVDEGPTNGMGDAAPMLMVHGNPTWSFYYRNFLTAFGGEHRVVAPDHIGCGLSDNTADFPYTLQAHTDNLVALIEKLDLQNITLLVHDWGGAIGLGAAVRLRERFSRLVMFNTGAFPPPFVPFRIRVCRTPVLGKLAVQGLNMFAKPALTMAVEKKDSLSPTERAGLIAPYDSWKARRAVYRFVADIPFTKRHPTWKTLEDLEANLPTLADLPAAMIWGMKDWCFTPACMDRLLKSLPNAETHKFEDSGHYVIEDSPEETISIVREFMKRHPLEHEPTGASV